MQLEMILNPQRPSPVKGAPLKYSGEPVSAFELVPSLLEQGIDMREGGEGREEEVGEGGEWWKAGQQDRA